MIELTNVKKLYRTDTLETTALSEIHLKVDKGAFISVMGPSGSGKSTLMNIMGLLDSPTEGSIRLDGQEIKKMKDNVLAQIRNEKIGFIFQSFHLIQDLSVQDNVELPLLYRKGIKTKQRKALAKEALDRVGLNARTKHFPSQLSGGQRQRVAIARAVVGRPQLLLADEPTGNLDSKMSEEILGILHKLNEEDKTTVVMVTHDEQQARQTQRIIRIFDGRQVQ